LRTAALGKLVTGFVEHEIVVMIDRRRQFEQILQ
jgi:hypothetical protein